MPWRIEDHLPGLVYADLNHQPYILACDYQILTNKITNKILKTRIMPWMIYFKVTDDRR